MDYEGENRDEIDFKNDIQDKFKAHAELTLELLNEVKTTAD